MMRLCNQTQATIELCRATCKVKSLSQAVRRSKRTESATPRSRVSEKLSAYLSLLLGSLLLASCATTEPPPPPQAAPQYWSISRTIATQSGMVTLLDPTDLAHHEAHPADWFRYDFAFANDLETGRFAAVFSDLSGKVDVRLTKGPLTRVEQQLAGPSASMRLRVINRRLLLAGGDTWPSNITRAREFAYDRRWINVDNGDYHVVITALDPLLGANHDFVFQLLPVADMTFISYAPGIPYLVAGQPPKVMGIGTGGLRYKDNCSSVKRTAFWSPLSSNQLPLPGTDSTFGLSAQLHARGSQLQSANRDAAVPILIARDPVPGAVGLFIQPDNWNADAVAINGEVPVNTQVLCAVTIRSVVPSEEGLELEIDPLQGDRNPMRQATSRRLVEQFNTWIRLSGDPAWRFKSARIQRTQDDRSVLLGIMDYLTLGAKHTEALLRLNNEELADNLIEHMTSDYASADN